MIKITVYDHISRLLSMTIVAIDEEKNNVSKPNTQVGTMKQYISGKIKFLEKRYKNIEILKERKRSEYRSWYSELKIKCEMKASARFLSVGLAISLRTKNIRIIVLIDVSRDVARLNTFDGFLKW